MYFILSDVTPAVAFTAIANEHQTVQDGERFQFQTVLTNAGGWYYPETSDFTCPFDGYYMFTFTLLTHQNLVARGYIYPEEGQLGPLTIADSSSDIRNHYGSGTSTHFVHCKQAEKVWVASAGLSDIHAYYTIFSGMLITASDP